MPVTTAAHPLRILPLTLFSHALASLSDLISSSLCHRFASRVFVKRYLARFACCKFCSKYLFPSLSSSPLCEHYDNHGFSSSRHQESPCSFPWRVRWDFSLPLFCVWRYTNCSLTDEPKPEWPRATAHPAVIYCTGVWLQFGDQCLGLLQN